MQRHFPGLDGIRALAVSMVVIGHASRYPEFPDILRKALVINVAHLGVVVFFVLSGFLITSLLIDERTRTGGVSLRDFYARRTIRIFPAAYAYIAVVAIAAAAGQVVLLPHDLFHAATYTMNYHHERAWPLGHLWSLAVEEQFYLLWPALFLLSGRRAIWLALIVVASVPVVRTVSWVAFPGERAGMDEEFQFVCDSLASGCLLALIVERTSIDGLAAIVPPWLFAAAPLFVVAGEALSSRPSLYLPFGMSAVNVGVGIVILWIVARPQSLPGRALGHPLAVFFGTISYSLYLWQQFFFNRDAAWMPHSLPLAFALSLSAATASYFLLERPLLALRSRFRR